MANVKVTPGQLRHAATTIRGLIDEYNGTMHNYLTGTQSMAGAGGWDGDASLANLSTTEEINNSQTRLTTRWTGLCEQMEQAAARYEEQERVNAQRQASVAHAAPSSM